MSDGSARSQLRRTLRAKIGRSWWKVSRAVSDAHPDDPAVDLVVSSVLSRPDLPSLVDPRAFVRFLRASFRRDRYMVDIVRSDETTADPAAVRFATLLAHLGSEVAPLPQATAVRLGLAADALLGEREPVESDRYAADVGLHAKLSSSFARKGRLLSTLVRFGRARSVFEIGTAYGMSALFLADALPQDGRLGTVECDHPQLDVSGRLLKEYEPERVITYAGLSGEVVDQVRRDLAPLDLLFHDGAHSREAYIDDFGAYEPLLAPGAMFLFDDIRWADERFGGDFAHTYDGWRRVVEHPRVRIAVELDTDLGLVLLH